MTDVVIIGGGVSGLSAACELKRRGYKTVVLERQVAAGGNAVSERSNGFLIEHGPTSLSASATEVVDLSAQMGLAGEQVSLEEEVRYRYLTKNGDITPIAKHPLSFLTSPYLSLAGRMRLASEPFRSSSPFTEEETLESFAVRRFGPEFTKRVIDPLVGGLFAARISDLSANAAFPTLVEMERQYGSVTRAAFSKVFEGKRMPARKLFSWRQGIGSLPRRLAACMGDDLITDMPVRRITRQQNGFHVDAGPKGSFTARAIVMATQPHVTGQLMERLDEDASSALQELHAPPLSIVFMGFKRGQVEHPLDGLGYLTPLCEGRSVSGALFPSSMFNGRAPQGHVSLSAYVSAERAPATTQMSEPELIDMVRQEYSELLGIRGEPVISRVRRWPQGLPQLRVGHAGRLARLDAAGKHHPGLFFAGNYFTGPGIAACVKRSLETAGEVDAHLSAVARPFEQKKRSSRM